MQPTTCMLPLYTRGRRGRNGGSPFPFLHGPCSPAPFACKLKQGCEGWVGKVHHSHVAPSSHANRGGGHKRGCAPIWGLCAAPYLCAAIVHNRGRGKGGVAPFLFPCKGWVCPSPSLHGYPFTHAPLPLCTIRCGNSGTHPLFLHLHFCIKGGEGRDKEERVGGAKCRKEGSKREGRTEGEGGAPHAYGGVNVALMAPSAAHILDEEEGNGGLFVLPCQYTHCLCIIFTYLSL